MSPVSNKSQPGITVFQPYILLNISRIYDEDKWRIPYLEKLLVERDQIETNLEDTKWIDGLIESICIN